MKNCKTAPSADLEFVLCTVLNVAKLLKGQGQELDMKYHTSL